MSNILHLNHCKLSTSKKNLSSLVAQRIYIIVDATLPDFVLKKLRDSNLIHILDLTSNARKKRLANLRLNCRCAC